MGLPVPFFSKVVEVSSRGDGIIVFIAPDDFSGSRHRYSVIEIDRHKGEATCIGRELLLAHARKLLSKKDF